MLLRSINSDLIWGIFELLTSKKFCTIRKVLCSKNKLKNNFLPKGGEFWRWQNRLSWAIFGRFPSWTQWTVHCTSLNFTKISWHLITKINKQSHTGQNIARMLLGNLLDNNIASIIALHMGALSDFTRFSSSWSYVFLTTN